MYGSVIWGDCTFTHLKITNNTKQLLKMIYNLPFFYSTARLHTTHNAKYIEEIIDSAKTNFDNRNSI